MLRTGALPELDQQCKTSPESYPLTTCYRSHQSISITEKLIASLILDIDNLISSPATQPMNDLR